MQFKDTACCAMQELSGLSNYESAKEAFMAFCRLSFNSQGKAAPRYWSFTGADLYSFYLFSAAVYMQDAPGVSYSGGATHKRYRPYGQEFADFILENKLGSIMQSPKAVNSAFHTDHGNQIWIWTVDKEAVKNWWQEHGNDGVVAIAKPVDTGCQKLEDLNYDNL